MAMKSSSLNGKTIRPGLLNYSFYTSDRHPTSRRNEKPKAKPLPLRQYFQTLLSVAVAVVIVGGTFMAVRAYGNRHSGGAAAPNPASQAAATADGPKECADNSLDKLVIVSVSERHLWACMRHKVVYDSPVVTGMEYLPADLTPRGTYHVYDKQTNVTLTGSDSTGDWSDPVSYWMPFLQNQYGTYGFHDATWRPNSDFGNVDPNSSKASHGCVELPLSTAKWLYSWMPVGTAVTVKN
ncbi:MAG TPA: L,D-transpeptidase [Candidatus Saccharimonadales bacterium]|nr:L,D-transpeptidase [Candidatus Saccharimonadales bacterium]